MSPLHTRSTLTRALPNLQAWVRHFSEQDIPVMAHTRQRIAELAERDAQGDEGVDAQLIAKQVGEDPLLALRILTHVSQSSRRARELRVETITEALVLMGISPFFRAFCGLTELQAVLGEEGPAWDGAMAVLRRGRRAGQFALGFSVHRMDPDAPMIHQAALLHDFAELLLWVHAPELALEIARRQQADPQLRSAQAQKAVLGIELNELQQALMRAWQLPQLLIRLGDDHQADAPSVRTVLLAIRVARHSAQNWHNPALPDDIHDIGELLQLAPEPTRRLLMDLDT